MLLLYAVPGGTTAQSHSFSYGGYAKNLGIYAQSFLTNESYVLDVTRLRSKGLWDYSDWLYAEAWLDTELLVGSFLKTPEYALSKTLERTTWLDLDWTLDESEDHHLRQNLFRGFATIYAAQTQITMGRQRVAWGTGFIWNPTDLLNPVNPTDIEREEKAGVDALYLSIPTGALSRIEVVGAPGRRRNQASTAVRGSANWHEYDLSGMVGYFRQDWIVGGDFAGYIGNAGFRGEAAFTRMAMGSDYVRAILNADYTFSGGTYALIEAYYNGAGASDKADYNYQALLTGTVFNLGRWYGAGVLARSLTPLLNLTGYGLLNLTDGSGLLGPALVWSVAENLELTGSTYLFLGADDSEFGAFSNAYFASLQYYF